LRKGTQTGREEKETPVCDRQNPVNRKGGERGRWVAGKKNETMKRGGTGRVRPQNQVPGEKISGKDWQKRGLWRRNPK